MLSVLKENFLLPKEYIADSGVTPEWGETVTASIYISITYRSLKLFGGVPKQVVFSAYYLVGTKRRTTVKCTKIY